MQPTAKYSSKSDLESALELLREAAHKVSNDETEEAILDFIDLMEQPIVKVIHDSDPLNPRLDYDHVGVMFCKHGRYTLGDRDAEDPIEEVEFYDLDGYEIEGGALQDAENMLQEWCDKINAEGGFIGDEDYDRAEAGYTHANRRLLAGPDRTEGRLRPDIALCLPLGLYDHGGITIFHGTCSAFDSDGWDSGQVGWHYMTKEAIEREFNGDLDRARKCLEAEVKEYDDFLQGNYWGYTIETRSGEDVDSCWGFHGDELEETGMLEQVEEKYREALKDAWERRFE